MYGINSTTNPTLSLATAVSYWVFLCRDKDKTSAMGIKTWDYFSSSIKNAAINSSTLSEYLQNLCVKLSTRSLSPKILYKIVKPEYKIIQVKLDVEGNYSEILELNKQQNFEYVSYEILLRDSGIKEEKIIELCRGQNIIITTHCRIQHEENKALLIKDIEEDDEE